MIGIPPATAVVNIQAHGRESNPYGQPLDFWREFLGLEGLLDDIPGDATHPDVFQRCPGSMPAVIRAGASWRAFWPLSYRPRPARCRVCLV